MTDDGLIGPRERIVSILHAHGERVSTSVLRRELDDSVDVLYHLNELADRRLIEPAGTVQTGSEGRGQRAKTYRLTESGRKRATDMFGDAPLRTVDEIASRVEGHNARISTHGDEIAELRNDVERMESDIQRVSDKFDSVSEVVADQVSRIDDRIDRLKELVRTNL